MRVKVVTISGEMRLPHPARANLPDVEFEVPQGGTVVFFDWVVPPSNLAPTETAYWGWFARVAVPDQTPRPKRRLLRDLYEERQR